jgi:hypothetical protein
MPTPRHGSKWIAYALRGRDLPQWPDWCFLPLRHAQAIVTCGSKRPPPYEPPFHRGILGALAAWRVSQGIYRFDRTLYDALIYRTAELRFAE